jgi:hypothetical protein
VSKLRERKPASITMESRADCQTSVRTAGICLRTSEKKQKVPSTPRCFVSGPDFSRAAKN